MPKTITVAGGRTTPREAWQRRLRPQLYLFRCSAGRFIDGGIGGGGAERSTTAARPTW